MIAYFHALVQKTYHGWQVIIIDGEDRRVKTLHFAYSEEAEVYARRFNKTQQVKARIAQLCEGRQ